MLDEPTKEDFCKMKIGLIGTGNMGTALMGGYLKANLEEKAEVFAFDVFIASLIPCGKRLAIIEV